MHDFDLIYTKGGEARIRVPLVLELEADIEAWRGAQQHFDDKRAKEEGREPINFSRELPTAYDVLGWNLMRAECSFRDFAWATAEFIESKMAEAQDSLDGPACLCDECREKLERSFLASE